MKKKIIFLAVFSLFVFSFFTQIYAEGDITPPSDITPPVITLKGDVIINLNVGVSYTDAGATATDNVDGDLTSSIVTVNPVDVNIAGTYTITYDVLDSTGNNAIEVTRIVNVTAVSEEPDENTNEDANFFIEKNIILKNSCEVKDTNGIIHIFPSENSSSEFLTICALEEALEQGFVDNIEFVDFGFGLFVNSINGISQENTYWKIFLNTISVDVGASQLKLKVDDIVSLILTAFDPVTYEEMPLDYNLTLKIESLNPVLLPDEQNEDICTNGATNPPICNNNSGGGGGGSSIPSNKLDVNKALDYLFSKQNSDGSFSSDLYTDWVAIAFASTDINSVNKSKIINYLKNNPLDSSITTDNERHAMALMALGINPYNGTSVDYIKKIVRSFDGIQIGEKNLWNDDIFGLIVLQNAGYTKNDVIIKNTISFIISKQSLDGSWGSVDMTSAGIEALNNFKSSAGVSDAIDKAENYLIESQNEDGGFENSSSTSWAIQALSLNNSYSSEINNAIKYLTEQQQNDGGLIGSDINNRIWVTSYAIPAILHKPWKDIMQSFEKPITLNNSSAEVLENTNLPILSDLVFCPEGDLFSTITGKSCTNIIEKKDIVLINNPVIIKNLTKIKKTENKEINKPEIIKNNIDQNPEISTTNNLGASVGNATSIKISIKEISRVVINSVVNVLAYMGKGFYSLIHPFVK